VELLPVPGKVRVAGFLRVGGEGAETFRAVERTMNEDNRRLVEYSYPPLPFYVLGTCFLAWTRLQTWLIDIYLIEESPTRLSALIRKAISPAAVQGDKIFVNSIEKGLSLVIRMRSV
jgi:hypothetical protein